MHVPTGAHEEVAPPPVCATPQAPEPAEASGISLPVKAVIIVAASLAACIVLAILIHAAMNSRSHEVAANSADQIAEQAGTSMSDSSRAPELKRQASSPIAPPPPAPAARSPSPSNSTPPAARAASPAATKSKPPSLSSLLKGALGTGKSTATTTDPDFPLPRVESVLIACDFPKDPHFGPCGCPVMLRGRDIVEWRSGQRKHTLDFGNNNPGEIRFSPQGTLVVANGQQLQILQAPAGRQVFQSNSASIDVKAFAGEKAILLSDPADPTGGLIVVDLAGSDVRKITLAGEPHYFHQATIAASPDGKEAATFRAGTSEIIWFNLTTGRKVREQKLGFNLNRDVRLCYSPAGDELHLCRDNYDQSQIIVWDRTQKIVENLVLPGSGYSVRYPRFECLPDNGGWVFNRWIIDRKAKIPVVSFAPADDSQENDYHVVDRDHVLIDLPALRKRIQDPHPDYERYRLYQIPWNKIRESLAARERGEAALLGGDANNAVSIRFSGAEVESSSLRPNAQAGIEDKLARRGLTLRAGAPVVIDVSVRPWQQDGLDLETFTLQWHAGGRRLVGWQSEATHRLNLPNDIVMPKARGQGTRTLQFSGKSNPARDLEIPYFVPQSPELVTLPVRVQ
jgi:hypothetical protein